MIIFDSVFIKKKSNQNLKKKQNQFKLTSFGSVFYDKNQLKPIWLGFGLVFFHFGLVFSEFFFIWVRFSFFSFRLIKPNRTGQFFKNFNKFNKFFLYNSIFWLFFLIFLINQFFSFYTHHTLYFLLTDLLLFFSRNFEIVPLLCPFQNAKLTKCQASLLHDSQVLTLILIPILSNVKIDVTRSNKFFFSCLFLGLKW